MVTIGNGVNKTYDNQAPATPNVVQAESVKVPKTNSVGNQASRQALAHFLMSLII